MDSAPLIERFWCDQATPDNEPVADWIWDGFVARGCLTLLTGAWKSGKTTLVSILLARRQQGGMLAGQAVQAGKTVVLTEENRRLWNDRARRHGLGSNVCIVPQPFVTIPTAEQWQKLIADITQMSEEQGLDLLIIDPLAPFLRCENQARGMLDTLLPLRELTRRGMGVLALHHPARGRRPAGQAARGSGALLGHADILIELRQPRGNARSRRRKILSLSRFQQSPPRLLLELNSEATDYMTIPETEAPETSAAQFAAQWHVLRMVLEDAPQKLTRRDILLEWPEDFDRPDLSTLLRWLTRAVRDHGVCCEGSGRKADPFRYWLPATEEIWRERFPLYDHCQEQARQYKFPFQSLSERRRIDRESARFTIDPASLSDDPPSCGDDPD